MRKIFKTLRITTADLCRIGLLTAITAVFAMLFTFRVGNALKIPFKFIPVFITGILYGPFWAGFASLFGDLLNALLMPVAAFMPQITAVEFVSGFADGLFLYQIFPCGRNRVLRVLCCVLVQLLLDILVTSALLAQAGFFPGFAAAVAVRFPCAVIKAAVRAAVIPAAGRFLAPLFRFLGGK